MISLHEQVCIDTYAALCHGIWKQWPAKSASQRQNAFIDAIGNIAGSMIHQPNFVFTVMRAGTNGSFSQTSRTLRANKARPQDNAITLENCQLLSNDLSRDPPCRAVLPHCPGACRGTAGLPAPTGPSVSEFGAGQSLKIQRLLNIPLTVAQKAIVTKADYQKFASLPRRADICTVGSGLNWDADHP